jgi:hypothetical protein
MAGSDPIAGNPRPPFNKVKIGLVTFEDLDAALQSRIEDGPVDLEGFIITPWGGFVYIKDAENNVTFVRK